MRNELLYDIAVGYGADITYPLTRNGLLKAIMTAVGGTALTPTRNGYLGGICQALGGDPYGTRNDILRKIIDALGGDHTDLHTRNELLGLWAEIGGGVSPSELRTITPGFAGGENYGYNSSSGGGSVNGGDYAEVAGLEVYYLASFGVHWFNLRLGADGTARIAGETNGVEMTLEGLGTVIVPWSDNNDCYAGTWTGIQNHMQANADVQLDVSVAINTAVYSHYMEPAVWEESTHFGTDPNNGDVDGNEQTDDPIYALVADTKDSFVWLAYAGGDTPYNYVSVELPGYPPFKLELVPGFIRYESRDVVAVDTFSQWCLDNEGALTALNVIGAK